MELKSGHMEREKGLEPSTSSLEVMRSDLYSNLLTNRFSALDSSNRLRPVSSASLRGGSDRLLLQEATAEDAPSTAGEQRTRGSGSRPPRAADAGEYAPPLARTRQEATERAKVTRSSFLVAKAREVQGGSRVITSVPCDQRGPPWTLGEVVGQRPFPPKTELERSLAK